MADNVGRQNSTRWAKATVPSYGDEWDDYEYEDEGDEQQQQQQDQHHDHHNLATHHEAPEDVEEEEGDLDEEDTYPVAPHSLAHSADGYGAKASSSNSSFSFSQPANNSSSNALPSADEGLPSPNPNDNLILSIDTFRSRQDSDSSDDDDDDDDEFNRGISSNGNGVANAHNKEEVEEEEEDLKEGVYSAAHQPQGADEDYGHMHQQQQQPEDAYNYESSEPLRQDSTNSGLSSHGHVQPHGSHETSQKEETPAPSFTQQHIAIDNRTRTTFEDHIMPPTPTYGTHSQFSSETPSSERSFTSDTDSIQKESDLYVRRAPSRKQPLPMDDDEDHGGVHKNDTIMQKSHSPVEAVAEREAVADSKPVEETPADAPAPLVLSIDKKGFASDDSDSDDDDWGYNSKGSDSDDEEGDNAEDIDEKGASDKVNAISPVSDVVSPASHEGNALDSLIDDLQHTSVAETGDDHRAYDHSVDSMHDISLPDFKNYKDTDSEAESEDKEIASSASPAPTEPLSIKHKGSVRKPPPTRSDLMSGDYTNIADAVKGYLPDEYSQKNSPMQAESIHSTRDTLRNIDEDTDSLALHPTESSGSLSTGKFSFAPSHSSNQMIVTTKLPQPTTSQPQSAGASSSVYSSVLPSPIDFMPPKFDKNSELSRRDSTMTTNTFNMGNWQPDTNNFRDKFISDNENDGRMSYNPALYDKETNANYNKFTTLGEVNEDDDLDSSPAQQENQRGHRPNDSMSTNSDISIPETIDAAVPVVPEEDDDEYGHDGTFNETSTHGTVDTMLKSVSTGADSVFKDKLHNSVFKEEKVTPMSSMLDVVDKNAGIDEKLGEDREKRLPSLASTASPSTLKRNSTSASQGGPSGAYPPYNWKNIMSKSQSIDRIQLLKDALILEHDYDSGLNHWLSETLSVAEESPTIHIGKIATAVYQNAPHSDIRRHNSLRTKATNVTKVSIGEASSLGKRFFHRSKKFIKSSD